MSDYKGTEQDDVIDAKALNLAPWTPIYGLGGNDQISAASTNMIGGPGDDILTGLNAFAEAAYWGSPAGIDADLLTGKVKDGWGGVDTLINIYNLQGTNFNDQALGSENNDRFHGNAGDDYFDGRGGIDTYAVYFEPSTNFSINYDAERDAFILESKGLSKQNGGLKILKNVEFVKFEAEGSDSVTIALAALLPSGFTRIAGEKIDAQDAAYNPRWSVGDFNGDGIKDIAIRYDPESAFSTTITGSAPLRFFLGTSLGGFSETTSLLTPVLAPTLVNRIQTTDLNKDGVPDILIGASGQDPYQDGKPAWDLYKGPMGEKSYVLLSKPGGGYALVDIPNMPSMFAHYLAVGDINNDGFVDAFVSSLSSEPSYILLSNKGSAFSVDRSLLPKSVIEPTFTTLTTFATGETKTGYSNQYTAAALFDVDGDGWNDLILLPVQNTATGKVIFNDGKGSFNSGRTQTLPAGPYGSGFLEFSSPSSNANVSTGTIYLDAFSADINGDGRLDLVTVSTAAKNAWSGDYAFYRGSSVSILINTPSGFVDETSTRSDFKHEPAVNYSHYDTIEYRDFNSDGFKDILVYRSVGNSDGEFATRILLNDGAGKFAEAPYPRGLSDGLIIVIDEVTSKYALPISSSTGQRSANGLGNYVQTVDGLVFDWSKGLDLFTGQPDGRGANLASDIPGRWVHGTAIDNIITLSSANEYAFGYQGNDTINGGAGYDTAVYTDRLADVSITLSGKSIIVSTKSEGTDTLTNVEALRFSDQTITAASIKRDLTQSSFTLVTDTGFAGSIGGTGRVLGTKGAQDISVSANGGSLVFDASFNAGGDIIRLPGNAADWTIQRTGSSAKLLSDAVSATIPIGTIANWIVFADGARALVFKDGSFKIGSQNFSDAAVTITPAADGNLPSLSLNSDTNARLVLAAGAEVSVGGKVLVMGTSNGKEFVEVLGGKISFDPSFNAGGDVIELPGNVSSWSAVRSGSSMLLTKGNDSASIPIGTVGADLAFDDASRALLFASGQFKIGNQVIEGSAPMTLLG